MPVREKHRPHASPAPRPGAEPKESWFMAAVNPFAEIPQAVKDDSEDVLLCNKYIVADIPGEPQPVYIVNDADPEGF